MSEDDWPRYSRTEGFPPPPQPKGEKRKTDERPYKGKARNCDICHKERVRRRTTWKDDSPLIYEWKVCNACREIPPK